MVLHLDKASALIPYTFKDSTFNFFGNHRSYSSIRVNITCSIKLLLEAWQLGKTVKTTDKWESWYVCNLYVMASMPPSYFDASGTSNAMLDELAERPPMSQLAGMKHTYM